MIYLYYFDVITVMRYQYLATDATSWLKNAAKVGQISDKLTNNTAKHATDKQKCLTLRAK